MDIHHVAFDKSQSVALNLSVSCSATVLLAFAAFEEKKCNTNINNTYNERHASHEKGNKVIERKSKKKIIYEHARMNGCIEEKDAGAFKRPNFLKWNWNGCKHSFLVFVSFCFLS